jgi:hypothetical protein
MKAASSVLVNDSDAGFVLICLLTLDPIPVSFCADCGAVVAVAEMEMMKHQPLKKVNVLGQWVSNTTTTCSYTCMALVYCPRGTSAISGSCYAGPEALVHSFYEMDLGDGSYWRCVYDCPGCQQYTVQVGAFCVPT